MVRNTEILEEWEMHTVLLENGEKTENHEKWETRTVGCEIWRETLKNVEKDKHPGL